ncbi:hypothetical protein KKI95_05880 [Xenorhabdus bovienii]|nr:hypothetical protein [Xenorhabdus bovienii]MDE9435470.1 hypothetical protein [Xenorhabdus bovienii]MDE9442988.1 hypothetical protein [Xenorhabdus bovienii]MDE9459549.1 hypothetical protein [Xenorhabdus bovienii]MDE9463326.1 hypothetical protein [Xenorhabdus bovienii]
MKEQIVDMAMNNGGFRV